MTYSGSSSATSEFGISFFAPLAYTYPPNEADLFPGQSLTVEQASQKVKTDLDLAVSYRFYKRNYFKENTVFQISKALTVNQLYLSTPPTVNFTFVPQKVQIADGEVCFTDGTSIAISGTIVYKCSIGGGSTVAPVSGATTQVRKIGFHVGVKMPAASALRSKPRLLYNTARNPNSIGRVEKKPFFV